MYVVRAVEKRRHSASSTGFSSRGSAFHSSSRSRIRLAPLRQSVPSAIFSASAAMRSFSVLARWSFFARSAFFFSRWFSMVVPSVSSRACEVGQVADRLGLAMVSLDLLDRGGGLVGAQGARADPLLEEPDLEGQVVVALGEERECLVRRGVGHLPDRALAVRGPDEDRAVLGHAAPALGLGTGGCGGLLGLGGAHGATSIGCGAWGRCQTATVPAAVVLVLVRVVDQDPGDQGDTAAETSSAIPTSRARRRWTARAACRSARRRSRARASWLRRFRFVATQGSLG